MRHPLPVAAAALLLGVGFCETRADLLHLKNGAVIQAEQWWIENDMVVYESPAGTVGIPRSLVRRIEPSVKPSSDASVPREEAKPPAADTRPRAAGPSTALLDQRTDLRKLMEEGVAAVSRRDFEEASSRFEQAWMAEPSLSAARVGYAASEMALGHDERVLPVLLDGLVLDPANGELHELLGDLRDREERVEDALRSWREAFRLSPNDRLRAKIEKGERELHAGRDYAFSAAPHFNIRYDGRLDARLAEEISEHLERSYREMSDTYRHSPSQPVTVLLYPEQQFRDVTQAGESVAGLYDGKIRVPLGGIRRIDDRARRVLVHELAHAVVHSKTRGNCPRWLHEGLAQRSEGRQASPEHRRSVAALLRAGDPASWEARGFSYPASLSLISYLESLRGLDGLLELLDRLAEGASQDAALERVFGENYASLCRRWAENVLSEARP